MQLYNPMPMSIPQSTHLDIESASPEAVASYEPSYCRLAQMICQLGGTSADLAEGLGATADLIDRWQAEHEEFMAACDAGREAVHTGAQQSLFRRCTGFEYYAERVLISGSHSFVEKSRVHIQPDLAACKLWLMNRRPAKWKKNGSGRDGMTLEEFFARWSRDLAEQRRRDEKLNERKRMQDEGL